MANTFSHDYVEHIQDTAYYTSNPNAITVLENHFESIHDQENRLLSRARRQKRYGRYDIVSVEELADYECLYRSDISNYNHKYPHPRSLTDKAIVEDRQADFDRMILHYMPPHAPYIAESSSSQEINGRKISLTETPRDFSYDAYLDNLRWGLNEVELLLDNIDRQNVVITADHGQCFSSYFSPHVSGQLNPTVRKVPWVRTEATDSKSYSPDAEMNTNNTEVSLEERLQALGYK
jgi:hypothetical protein